MVLRYGNTPEPPRLPAVPVVGGLPGLAGRPVRRGSRLAARPAVVGRRRQPASAGPRTRSTPPNPPLEGPIAGNGHTGLALARGDDYHAVGVTRFDQSRHFLG